jgi:exosortase/archaeosortase family protein
MIQKQMSKIQEVLPGNIRKFFLRAVILIVGWNLLYHLLLKPALVPDRQLTDFVIWGTIKFLSLFHSSVFELNDSIYLYGVRSVSVAHSCNGLELIVLYLGFLFCLPSEPKRMLVFAIAGTAVICFLNFIRCGTLAWMFLNMRTVVDFAHHYLFKLIIYAVVFYGWVLYVRKHGEKES